MNVPSTNSSIGPLLLTATLALGLSACSLPNATVTEAAAEVSDPFSSSEILQVVHVINTGEIQQAELALQKSFQPEVRNAAQLIIRDHTELDQQVQDIAQPGLELQETTLSNGIQVQSEEIREELAELSGTEFNCTYLQKQVELHRIGLETVRTELQPDAEDPQVSQLLSNAEPILSEHLQAAQQSLAELEGCSGQTQS